LHSVRRYVLDQARHHAADDTDDALEQTFDNPREPRPREGGAHQMQARLQPLAHSTGPQFGNIACVFEMWGILCPNPFSRGREMVGKTRRLYRKFDDASNP
jgi:hypothetical protein